MEKLRPAWTRFVLGGRSEVLLALDWAEFDDDDHSTLCIYVVTTHGRATPLAWQPRKKSLLMLLLIAIAFRTRIGAAPERAGMDAWMRANTVERRTRSLFRQGSCWYRCLPTMRDE